MCPLHPIHQQWACSKPTRDASSRQPSLFAPSRVEEAALGKTVGWPAAPPGFLGMPVVVICPISTPISNGVHSGISLESLPLTWPAWASPWQVQGPASSPGNVCLVDCLVSFHPRDKSRLISMSFSGLNTKVVPTSSPAHKHPRHALCCAHPSRGVARANSAKSKAKHVPCSSELGHSFLGSSQDQQHHPLVFPWFFLQHILLILPFWPRLRAFAPHSACLPSSAAWAKDSFPSQPASRPPLFPTASRYILLNGITAMKYDFLPVGNRNFAMFCWAAHLV